MPRTTRPTSGNTAVLHPCSIYLLLPPDVLHLAEMSGSLPCDCLPPFSRAGLIRRRGVQKGRRPDPTVELPMPGLSPLKHIRRPLQPPQRPFKDALVIQKVSIYRQVLPLLNLVLDLTQNIS